MTITVPAYVAAWFEHLQARPFAEVVRELSSPVREERL